MVTTTSDAAATSHNGDGSASKLAITVLADRVLVLVPQADGERRSRAGILIPAVGLYHTLTQVLRLCLDRPFLPDEAPRGLKELLARAAELPDFPSLTAVLIDALGAVQDCFERIVR